MTNTTNFYAAYPDNWQELRQKCLERAGYRCENCGIPQGAQGFRTKKGNFIPASYLWDIPTAQRSQVVCDEEELHRIELQPYLFTNGVIASSIDFSKMKQKTIWLHSSHIDRVPSNPDIANLRALCPYCHFAYDREVQKEKRKATLKRNRLTVVGVCAMF